MLHSGLALLRFSWNEKAVDARKQRQIYRHQSG